MLALPFRLRLLIPGFPLCALPRMFGAQVGVAADEEEYGGGDAENLDDIEFFGLRHLWASFQLLFFLDRGHGVVAALAKRLAAAHAAERQPPAFKDAMPLNSFKGVP